MRGEFESAKAIYDLRKDFHPRPIAYNPYKSNGDQWFFLCEFHDFADGLVEPRGFCKRLANLHRSSFSSNGKFGFHYPTSEADEEWNDTWEECYTKMIRKLLEKEWKCHGPDKTLARLSAHFLQIVTPSLSRPLETEGRLVKPSLVHGDLWYGNARTGRATG